MCPIRLPRALTCLLALLLMPCGPAVADPFQLSDAERAWLAEHPVLRLGVDPAWAPYEFVDGGRYRGLAADYMDLISGRLGVRFEVVRDLSWPQVMTAARERRIDLLPAAMATPERQAYLRFTRPYLNFPMVAIMQADAAAARTLHDLNGHRVGVVDGYVAADLLARDYPAIDLRPVESLRDGLKLLATGGLDAFVDNLAPVSHAIAKTGLTNLEVAFETRYGYPLAIAVRSDWPELAAILDKALASIDEAERRAIAERWLLLRVEEGYSVTAVVAIVFGVLVLLLLATGGVFQVNGRLRMEVAERRAVERALRASEMRLLASQRIAGVGSWERNLDDGRSTWSDEIYRIFAIDPGAEVPRFDLFMSFIHPEDRARVTSGIDAVNDAAGPLRMEYRIVRRDGSTRYVEEFAELNCDGAGAPRRLIGTLHDITARKQAEQALRREKETMQRYLDVAAVMLLALDREGRIALINRRGCELLDYVEDELRGCDWFDTCLPAEQAPAVRDYFRRIIAGDADVPDSYENPVRTRGGGLRLVAWQHTVLRDDHGTVSGLLASGEDVTDSRRAERELRLTASVFENTHEAIIITDANQRILRVNRAFSEITGYTEAEAQGSTPGALVRSGHHDCGFYRALWQTLGSEGRWQGEIWNRRRNGEVFAAWQTINAVHDADGVLSQYIGVFSDITEQKSAERRIRHLAHYDVLTDLPNRMLFNDRLHHALDRARRNGGHLALLFIDLDRFKNVNDTLGHPAGDRLLVEVAERLRECLRDEDTIARLGGDEFTVILEDVAQTGGAALVAEKVIRAVMQPVDLDGYSVVAGASIGISLFPNDGDDEETLLRNADAAMYRAKEQGRNTYQFYTPELTRQTRERFDTENALRQAIEAQQLVLHYQPQVDAASGRLVGAEALVRWQHPQLGMVPPDRFIPLAEETGLIEPLGRWVVMTACRQARQWLDEGLRLRMGVNVSGFEIERSDHPQ